MTTIRLPDVDEITSDEDLKRWLEHNRKVMNFIGWYLANSASVIKGILKTQDKRVGGQKRAHQVSRPIAIAAGSFVVLARLFAVAHRRFTDLYGPDIRAARAARGRQRRETPRSIRFGD